MPEFSSSAVTRIEHDPFTHTLSVWFRGGTMRYAYEGVPSRVYQAFCRATSKGAFFQRYIRGRFDLVDARDELDQTVDAA